MIKNDITKFFEQQQDKLFGIYKGVIEDNNDPEKMGRCKIRIIGIHSPKKIKKDMEGIPTDELPWSEPALGLFGGSVTGVGSWTIPVQGSLMFIFFEQGHILKPRYFASVPGKPSDINHGFKNSEGFSDPDNIYPNETIISPHKPNGLNESDYHKLAKGETTNTIVESKNNNRDTNISIAKTGTWDEPVSAYNATYPENNVISSKSGITIEVDDTPDNERIHVYHPSGTYIEIDSNGNMVIRNASNKFEIIDDNKKSHIINSYDRNVGSTRTSKVGSTNTEEIGGDNLQQIDGDMILHIDGKLTISAVDGIDIWSGGNINQDGTQIHLNDGLTEETEI